MCCKSITSQQRILKNLNTVSPDSEPKIQSSWLEPEEYLKKTKANIRI